MRKSTGTSEKICPVVILKSGGANKIMSFRWKNWSQCNRTPSTLKSRAASKVQLSVARGGPWVALGSPEVDVRKTYASRSQPHPTTNTQVTCLDKYRQQKRIQLGDAHQRHALQLKLIWALCGAKGNWARCPPKSTRNMPCFRIDSQNLP